MEEMGASSGRVPWPLLHPEFCPVQGTLRWETPPHYAAPSHLRAEGRLVSSPTDTQLGSGCGVMDVGKAH